MDFAISGPLVRRGMPPIRFLFIDPCICCGASSKHHLAVTPLRFASPSPHPAGQETFTPKLSTMSGVPRKNGPRVATGSQFRLGNFRNGAVASFQAVSQTSAHIHIELTLLRLRSSQRTVPCDDGRCRRGPLDPSPRARRRPEAEPGTRRPRCTTAVRSPNPTGLGAA